MGAGGLERIEGFDAELALRNVGGEPRSLVQVLGCFVDAYAAGEPALLGAPTAGMLRRWRAVCHSVRGAAAMIGARSISDSARALEDAIDRRDGDAAGVAAAARRLDEALRDLSRRLAAALGAAPPG